jgi:hypothetical protein
MARVLRVRIVWLVVSALVAGGCGSSGREPLYPVHGKVLFRGQPAAGALVVLHPAHGQKPGEVNPLGIVGKDGTFLIGSRMAKDGAAAGDYAVTIVWREQRDPEKYGDDAPPDRLRNRYNDPRHAKWRVRVVPGKNELQPFLLR